MTKSASEKLYNTFVKGLITEANALTFPENASLDEDNFILERNGTRSRRLGMSFEDSYVLRPTGVSIDLIDSTVMSFHKWDSPGGDTSISMGVIRVYESLWFVNLLTDTLSANLLNGGASILISGIGNSTIQASVLNGNLIIAASTLDAPVLLTYDRATQLVAQRPIPIFIRDIWGVADGLAITDRPLALTETHRYNLKNQSWNPRVVTTCGYDAIDCTFDRIGKYPSNADIWTLAKVANTASADIDKYDPLLLERNSTDNAAAPMGSHIINAFTRGTTRSTASGLGGLPLDWERGRISTVASYAGRIFYSGVVSDVSGGDARSPNYSGIIFFSQLAQTIDSLGKCYQEADPTSNNISDIIATDGGTIQIPDVTRIYKLLATKSSLLVFAQNGVWEIFGDTGGFNATSFQSSRISSVGTTSPRSVVDVNGSILYWAKSGIFSLDYDAVSGRYSAKNITISSIQTLYNSFAHTTINSAIGFYDEWENRVRWLFNQTCETNGVLTDYNRELILDLTLEAFYPHTITTLDANSPRITDYVEIPNYYLSDGVQDVYASSELVQVSTDTVVVPDSTPVPRSTRFAFLTSFLDTFTFSRYSNNTFTDWEESDGVGGDFRSYMITGYEIFGDVMRNKQIAYFVALFNRTEDRFAQVSPTVILDHQSSCMVQAQWNWADSIYSGKWGNKFQAYRLRTTWPTPLTLDEPFKYGESVIVTKNKLRGRGKTLAILIESETGKDLQVLGWALSMEAGVKV